jgi:hypothetical protein
VTRRTGIKQNGLEIPWPGTFRDSCPRCGAALREKDDSDEDFVVALYECGHAFGWKFVPDQE